MKAAARIFTTIFILLGTISPVCAATGARQDSSGIVVWAFLGFCAMIIAAQLVPALLMMLGLVKGTVGSTQEKPAKEVRS